MGRFGRLIDSLTISAEDRVLTSQLTTGTFYNPRTGARCLVGAIVDARQEDAPEVWAVSCPFSTAMDFDAFCRHVGEDRVFAAVRGRILRNRLRRTLQSRPVQHLESVSR